MLAAKADKPLEYEDGEYEDSEYDEYDYEWGWYEEYSDFRLLLGADYFENLAYPDGPVEVPLDHYLSHRDIGILDGYSSYVEMDFLEHAVFTNTVPTESHAEVTKTPEVASKSKPSKGKYGGKKTARWANNAIDTTNYEDEFEYDFFDHSPYELEEFEERNDEYWLGRPEEGEALGVDTDFLWGYLMYPEHTYRPRAEGDTWDKWAYAEGPTETYLDNYSPYTSVNACLTGPLTEADLSEEDLEAARESTAHWDLSEEELANRSVGLLQDVLTTGMFSRESEDAASEDWWETEIEQAPFPINASRAITKTPKSDRGAIFGTYIPKQGSPLRHCIDPSEIKSDDESEPKVIYYWF